MDYSIFDKKSLMELLKERRKLKELIGAGYDLTDLHEALINLEEVIRGRNEELTSDYVGIVDLDKEQNAV